MNFKIIVSLLISFEFLLANSFAAKTKISCPAQEIHNSSQELKTIEKSNVISFENLQFPKEYNQLMENLKVGDIIVFPGGQEFQVHGILGNGQLTKVVDIGNGWALRIPLHDGKVLDFMAGRLKSAMNEFLEIQKELKASGIDVVDVDLSRSHPPFGIVVKKKDFWFKGDDFTAILAGKKTTNLSPKKIKKAEEALKDFLKKTWAYTGIGDFAPRQMGFDGEKWVLFDFSHYASPMHAPLRNFKEKNIVGRSLTFEDSYGTVTESFFPEKMLKEVKEDILKTRKKKKKSSEWFERSERLTGSRSEMIDRVTPSPLPKGYKKFFRNDEGWEFSRDFSGLYPGGSKIEIEIVEEIKRKDNIATYSVMVNGKYSAKMKMLIGPDDKAEEIYKLSKKAKKNNESYLSGSDFILSYDPPVKEKLVEIK